MQQIVSQIFRQRYGRAPRYVIRAPGRVNLIGEHTDYNNGFVLPMAIDRAIWIAAGPRGDDEVHIFAHDKQESGSFVLSALEKQEHGWMEYLKGVAWSMQRAGYHLKGWEGVVAGDVPLGAGLSSSAALEMATARTFASISTLGWDAPAMAKLGQEAENEWIGVECGIMDQMISAAGQAGHALLIDCRSLEIEPVPLPADARVVILDTSTRRGLVESAYNKRRAECLEASRQFQVDSLRDLSPDVLSRHPDTVGELLYRRARHVVTEIARTKKAAEVLRQGDAIKMGKLMVASHASMRDDFEISSPALDAMVRCALMQKGCHGARMTGGGFAGCAVALVEAEVAPCLVKDVAHCYRQATGLEPHTYVCQATDGASVVVDNTII